MRERYEVIIVGGGPAGSTCAAVCAQAGLSTLVLERSKFPREKVCGDCLNPGCQPILERLGLSQRVRALPHAVLKSVHFAGAGEETLGYALPPGAKAEIAVKRSHFDHLLLTRAAELGAEVHDGVVLMHAAMGTDEQWMVRTSAGEHASRWLIAADGRNSTVGRLLDLLPAARQDRVGLQTHFPLPADTRGRVVMRFLPVGYCGLADVGEGLANLCLVAQPHNLASLKTWAAQRFALPAEQAWRTITPLSRAPVTPVHPGLLLAGDAARVVEPFTGEGIYYALASGELAAQAIIANDPAGYRRAHAGLYRGRLWVNQAARFACLHPWFAEGLLAIARRQPALLRFLTRKVVGK